MTTRGSLARGHTEKHFVGRVRHWEKREVDMSPASELSSLSLLRWVPTGQKCEAIIGPRFPHLVPVPPEPREVKAAVGAQGGVAAKAPDIRRKAKGSLAAEEGLLVVSEGAGGSGAAAAGGTGAGTAAAVPAAGAAAGGSAADEAQQPQAAGGAESPGGAEVAAGQEAVIGEPQDVEMATD